jgi:hypothetical protein
MPHKEYTEYLDKEIDFLKILVTRIHHMEAIDRMELDIALQKTRQIYETLLRMSVSESFAEAQAVQQFEEQPIPVVEQYVEPEPQVQQPQLKPQAKKQPKQAVPQQVEEPKGLTSKFSILAEKISQQEASHINEARAQQVNDLSSRLQTAPLSSMALGIGLNDKFLYIRELFNGDKDMFDRVIKYLDKTDTLENALLFINYHFAWDNESEAAQKFITLIHRRHSGT